MSTEKQCVTCSRCDLRGAEKMAPLGFALCERKRSYEFVSVVFPRQCGSHQPAPDAIVASRRKWLEKKGVGA